jgi:hypothetical protein
MKEGCNVLLASDGRQPRFALNLVVVHGLLEQGGLPGLQGSSAAGANAW